jgi:hypothetical protein
MSIDLFLWPMEALQEGSKPVISDGFKPYAIEGVRRQHLGVDVMYARVPHGEPSPPDMTKGFKCPSGKSPVIACGPGKVYSVDPADKHGVCVKVDHGQVGGFGPCLSVYRHLASLKVAKGQVIPAGTFLGFAGKDLSGSKTTPNHLHFELWKTDRPRASGQDIREAYSIDPEPYMRRWKVKAGAGFTVPTTSPAGSEDAGEADFEEAQVLAIGALVDLSVIHGGIL